MARPAAAIIAAPQTEAPARAPAALCVAPALSETSSTGPGILTREPQLSSGETRLISYVTLFAAASAFYDAVSAGAERPPVRLVLLDEAFERLDEPTIARMLGLLVDLDMDWIITWPSGWGLSEKIPRMHIYDVLRPKGGRGIACTHAIWTGNALTEQAVAEAARAGAGGVSRIYAALDCAPQCGKCLPRIRAILEAGAADSGERPGPDRE